MKATKEVNIYLTNKRNIVPIDVVQYDTGIQIIFTSRDFTIPSDATATLYVQKPSGKFVYQADGITVSGNTITVDLENQALTEHGKVPYQVTITSGSDTITSFAGLMLVEKSLKDAGATESKTVMKAFDELTAEKVAEFQANAATIANAVIATIPDDYTAMTAKVNESANAIKGYLSGAVVRADDVSPVEHYPVVRVHSKNRFISSKIGTTSKFTKNNDGSITVSAGQYSCPTGIQFKDLCPSLSAGETVILSIDTEGLNFIYSNAVLKHGVPFVVTENILEGYVAIYGAEETANDFEEEHTIRHIQIEKGDTATEYTPYIDPSTVTVTRCGKNLLPYPFNGTVYDNGITFTDNGDGSITLNGTNNGESNSVLYITKDTYITIPKGEYIGVPSTSGVSIMGVEKGGGYLTLNRTLILNEAVTFRSIYVQIGKGVTETYNNIKIRPMLELGKISTEYEMYCGEKYTPNTDGTIDGLTSVSPTMTLLTDTEGVTVECEYNKDTNKVISKLAEALGITI